MTILIVDDQISVVSGLYFGINWKKIGIQKVLKAYSAYEAKEILKVQKVDIMLCDIEMPVEDGLSLLAWVREQKYDTECIFLTAYADFIYAKEAISLGSFDYILQPARYEDIEQTIERLISKIQAWRQKEEMAFCGDVIKNRKNIFMDAVLNRLMFGTGDAWKQAVEDLQKLGIPLVEEESSYAALLVLHDEDGRLEDWNNDLIKYAIENILEEIFFPYGYGILLCAGEQRTYSLYFYRREPCIVEKEILLEQFERFVRLYKEFSGCNITCYLARSEKLEQVKDAVGRLSVLKQSDVTREGRVVDEENGRRQFSGYEQIRRYFAEIEPLLHNELYEKISDDVIELMDRLTLEKNINAEVLQCCYQDFLSIVYQAAGTYGKTLSEMFDEEKDRERALKAFATLDEMKWFVKYIMAYLNEMSMSDEKQRSQIDCICQYIRSNIDMDIKRTDIAELVHLNPNYVSRLFKNETGISLKEYIMKEKMELAKELVRNTGLPVSVITMKVGYNNFSYFAQVYKKAYGLSPTEDRERNGKGK